MIEPSALAAARRSLEESGFLLLGELHGVRENPLFIRALMRAFGLSGLALEWPEDLASVARAFLAGERLADHPLLWFGDGRITAGHLAVLRERAAAGPLSLTLFDGTMSADWNWSQRDGAMAGRTWPLRWRLRAPWLSRAMRTPARPVLASAFRSARAWRGSGRALREIRIRYGGGHFYNIQPRRFRRRLGLRWRARLHERRGSLVLDLPAAGEAVVLQRPMPWLARPHLG